MELSQYYQDQLNSDLKKFRRTQEKWFECIRNKRPGWLDRAVKYRKLRDLRAIEVAVTLDVALRIGV